MTKRKIYGTVFILLVCFIWGNSILSGDVSGAISQFFADIFGGEGGASDEEHFLVRKLAHFSEFALLGVVTDLFLDTLTADSCRKYLSVALVGIFVPLMDETIQIFSDRGYSVIDVWIDISGYIFGSLLILFILYLSAKCAFVKDAHKDEKKT